MRVIIHWGRGPENRGAIMYGRTSIPLCVYMLFGMVQSIKMKIWELGDVCSGVDFGGYKHALCEYSRGHTKYCLRILQYRLLCCSNVAQSCLFMCLWIRYLSLYEVLLLQFVCLNLGMLFCFVIYCYYFLVFCRGEMLNDFVAIGEFI